ncbi:MAG: phenylalanine--tRNA ligase subunit alpha [Opitutales bacterium]
MQDQLQAILSETENALSAVEERAQLDQLKATVLGGNGSLTAVMKEIRSLSKEDRPAFGQAVNQVKTRLEELFRETLARIEVDADTQALAESVDPTLPPPGDYLGGLHPLTLVKRRMVSIFRTIGFSVAEATEVESEWFCFDALNTPEDHPARDEQDTLFFPSHANFGNVSRKEDEAYMLRTHTSSVQIRTMLDEEPPIRVIAPGRCFRRDTADATHSANFHQIEGLFVDHKVTVKDLKAVLDHLLHELFGKELKTRLRPSFFPFTEPSFEVDIFSPNLGRLSDKWIEIMGCGMVDPEVFVKVGLDPEEWTGYAFGLGIERVAMILHGIDDIRHFYQNDLRFLEQF